MAIRLNMQVGAGICMDAFKNFHESSNLTGLSPANPDAVLRCRVLNSPA